MSDSKFQPLTTVVNKYPTFRDDIVNGCWKWLKGRRADDNAEGLWRVHDKLYDLKEFKKTHPGGREWLTMTEVSKFILSKLENAFLHIFREQTSRKRSKAITFATSRVKFCRNISSATHQNRETTNSPTRTTGFIGRWSGEPPQNSKLWIDQLFGSQTWYSMWLFWWCSWRQCWRLERKLTTRGYFGGLWLRSSWLGWTQFRTISSTNGITFGCIRRALCWRDGEIGEFSMRL